jgi:hypothetical protein
LVCALGVVGGAGAQERGTPPEVNCETRSQLIGPGPDPSSKDITAGPVSFFNARAYANWDHRFFEPRRPGWLASVKLPIIVETGAGATLTLSTRSARHAQLAIGRNRGRDLRGPEATLVPCPPGAEVAGRPVGPRTAFLGGFRVDGPQCLEITVTAASMPAPRIRALPLGREGCGRR